MTQSTTVAPDNKVADLRESPKPASVIEASDVDVVYGPVWALAGASLTVMPGEWIAITGPSGSGKSTLLQLFAGLDVPTRGKVLFRGADLHRSGSLDHYRRREVGLVFQLHNLLPHLDARQNIEVAMFSTHRGGRQRFERAMELLSSVNLAPQASRRPPEMSGGERQRVAIA